MWGLDGSQEKRSSRLARVRDYALMAPEEGTAVPVSSTELNAHIRGLITAPTERRRVGQGPS